ncbi:oxidoreductase [Fusarium albosuccineum]|uniref:Oxidoreductase n=1 Tax=Fusarium albosuccineum TaxID=1237068 RepID=A0A8H4L7X3_9HYPO|nr:oxidoreductase [Fusarium albosuccineum]
MSDYAKYRDAYANPKGARDARPTAQDIIDQEDLHGKWTDKVIMITGASASIGVETARVLATTGARIYLPVRSPGKTEEALGDLIKNGQITLLELDLDAFDSVRKAAAAFLEKEKALHVLIENAGLMAPPEGRTKNGFETQFGVNHLSHFLLLNLLKDALIAGSTPEFNSRVVILSSSAHRTSSARFNIYNFAREYDPWLAYGQSKTANVWTANHFDRLCGTKGVHAYSLNPSVVRTSLGRFMPSETVKAAF